MYDRLLAFSCLLYYFYRNVYWCRRFTYFHMYSYQSLIVPVYVYAARRSCAAEAAASLPADPVFRPCWPGFTVCYCMTINHVTAALFKIGRDFTTLSSQTLLNKIDSAVNIGETSSSEFVQCVLWVIRLAKPLSRPTALFVTLWHYSELSEERYAHHIQFEFWLLRRLTPAVIAPVLRR